MSQALSESQSAALFDILTHYDTYAEIRNFRTPGSLKHYGPPFSHEDKKPSTSPALQTLVSRFLLTLPGLKDLPDEFWTVQVHEIIESLEKAELSESYDKGLIGSRKTLATAISALIEYPVRGTFGGFAKVKESKDEYDLSSAEDLSRSFRDFSNQAIYGTVLEDLVKKVAETDQLSDHGPLIKAVHEFVLVNLASFMHYILILSPKGQYLLKLIENVHKLIPYVVVRQTLKIGNVASMISGLVKIGLAKMSVASFTNWMGLTQTEDEGMNLVQQIISTVMQWDIKDLETRATKIEKEKNGPTKEQLQALKAYDQKSREEHEKLREQSQKESISIVIAILKSASKPTDLTEANHKLALDYLSTQLSIRDRKEIVRTLCNSTPDQFTTSVRSLVTAYEPVIRQMHNAIDLSETVWDLEMFIRDMLKLGKLQSSSSSSAPSVGDFVQLLKKHQYSSHKFIHQCCKNGKEVTAWYLEWAKTAASHFNTTRRNNDITITLNDLFTSLDTSAQSTLLPILDAQTAYLAEMHTSSLSRLSSVLSSPPSKNPAVAKVLASSSSSRPSSRSSSPARSTLTSKFTVDASAGKPAGGRSPPVVDSDPGPGAYLSRWQDLLHNTPITPLKVSGAEVESARSKGVVERSSRDVDGKVLVDVKSDIGGRARAPDVKAVVEALGERFKEVLAERGCYW